MPPAWVSPPSFLATTPPGVSSIPIWPSVHPVPFNLIASLEYLKLIFISYWSGLIIGENIMPTWIRPPLCLSVQTASDWGCCFSSCLLYKLIWPETFALLGAERDVMLADTSWRPSPLCWLQALWWSLVLYLTACSYQNITSPFFDRRKNSIRCETRRQNRLQASYWKSSTSPCSGKLKLCLKCGDSEDKMLDVVIYVLKETVH